jgi:hypothetical protein
MCGYWHIDAVEGKMNRAAQWDEIFAVPYCCKCCTAIYTCWMSVYAAMSVVAARHWARRLL